MLIIKYILKEIEIKMEDKKINDELTDSLTLKELVAAVLSEQRAKRRWSVFFKICIFCLILFVLWRGSDWGDETAGEH
jgi:hypothetical protein